MKSSRFLWLALAVLLLAPAGAGAQVPLDHFLVYEQTPIPAGYTVRVAGQFDASPVGVSLAEQTHFANPTQKEHSDATFGINDPWRHLNWYRILQSTSEPLRKVRYYNQFGDQTVEIQSAVFLLVPAEKLSHPGGSEPPQEADHYKCYEVVTIGNQPPTPVIGLSDQFQTRDDVGVFSPVYFCVPVTKDHDGVIHPIYNPEEHLVVYEISPWSFLWPVTTQDQFQAADFEVQRTVWLAVPTEKISWAVASETDPVGIE